MVTHDRCPVHAVVVESVVVESVVIESVVIESVVIESVVVESVVIASVVVVVVVDSVKSSTLFCNKLNFYIIIFCLIDSLNTTLNTYVNDNHSPHKIEGS
jgi:hypothetical protein